MIKLSIIIPHYNSIKTLEKLLKSIPYSNEIEILVIDDHSDIDNKEALEILKEDSSHKNIEFLNNEQSKKGAGVCRNIGLNKAKGDWILFADADDFFIDGFYSRVYKHLSSDNDVIFFKPTSLEVDSGKLAERHVKYARLIDNYLDKKDLKSKVLLSYSFVVPWSKLIKKSFIQEYRIKFDEVIVSNDVMFSTKVGHYMEKFEVIDSEIYCVTRSKGSLTTTINNKNFDTRLKVFIDYYKFLKRNLSQEEFKELSVSGRFYLFHSRKLGYKKTLSVYKELKKNKVHIFDFKILNPIWIIKTFLLTNKEHNEIKKHYS